MKRFFPFHAVAAVILIAAWLSVPCLRAEDKLVWHTAENRVDADIRSWTLDRLLEKLAADNGWEAYVEPGTRLDISVKFNGLTTDEALNRMLGKVNYALLPQTNGPPRFFVFRTTLGKATEKVAGPDKNAADPANADLIPEELIVVLSPNAGISIEDLAKRFRAKIVGRNDALRAYRLRFENADDAKAAMERLREMGGVASVENNYRIRKQPPVMSLQLASSSPFPLNPTALNDPNNVIVGLLDTAVQPLPAEMERFILKRLSVAGDAANPSEGLMHGTPMAETILQGLAMVAGQNPSSKVKILAVDIYGPNPMTTVYELGIGINAAVRNGATIINMSLGSYGNSGFLGTLIANSHAQGVVFYAAGGNEPVSTPVYPAALPQVNGVTAGSNGQLAPYANFGSFNEIIAPGTSVVKLGNNYYVVAGTSTATAYASGWAAGLADTKQLTGAALENAVKSLSPFNSSGY